MSIGSQINRINTNIVKAYDALEKVGATLPIDQNSDNLESTIQSVPSILAAKAPVYNSDKKLVGSGYHYIYTYFGTATVFGWVYWGGSITSITSNGFTLTISSDGSMTLKNSANTNVTSSYLFYTEKL